MGGADAGWSTGAALPRPRDRFLKISFGGLDPGVCRVPEEMVSYDSPLELE